MRRLKVDSRDDLQVSHNISYGHVLIDSFELVAAGHSIGYGELGGKAAQLGGKYARVNFIAVEAEPDILTLGRESRALDGDPGAG